MEPDVLGAGISYPTITLTVTVASNATSPKVNQVHISGGGETTTNNNDGSDSTTILPAPVQLTILLEPHQPGFGGDSDYTHSFIFVRVKNGSGSLVTSTTGASNSSGSISLTDPSFLSSISDSTTYHLVLKPEGYLAQEIVTDHLISQSHSFSTPFTAGDFSTPADGSNYQANGIGAIDLSRAISAYNGTSNSQTISLELAFNNVVFGAPQLSRLINRYNAYQGGTLVPATWP